MTPCAQKLYRAQVAAKALVKQLIRLEPLLRCCKWFISRPRRSGNVVQEAQPGARAHGHVTGVQDYGVFVGFCGDLRGLAPVAELGLPAGHRPSQGFKVGQASCYV